MSMASIQLEIAAIAARLIVEDGEEYGPAKRRALKQLALPQRTPLPDNHMVEEEVKRYIELFCSATQAQELQLLRQLAHSWMERLAHFRPHLSGAVWRGTATRHNDIYLELYCDDAKETEIELINQGIDYQVGSTTSGRGHRVDQLTLATFSNDLNQPVLIHLSILDYQDLRGRLKPDTYGQAERGDLKALQRLIANPTD